MRNKYLNSYIDNFSFNEVISYVEYAVDKKIKTNIVFQNSLKIYQISKNQLLKTSMENAELILADGMPVVWTTKLTRNPLLERVNGTDLFINLLELANKNQYKVFLFGAKQRNLEILVEKINKSFPSLNLAGYRNGYFDESDEVNIIDEINRASPDMLFLGFSSPKKEIWSDKYKTKLNVPVIQGVGGSFDVLAGIIPRAPHWMQKLGLEWFYRLLKEPRRMFKRYLFANSYFIYLAVQYIVKERIIKKPN